MVEAIASANAKASPTAVAVDPPTSAASPSSACSPPADAGVLQPPVTLAPPARKAPRKRHACSVCGQLGHTARTCDLAVDVAFLPPRLAPSARPKPTDGKRAFGMRSPEKPEPELTGVADVLPTPIATFIF